MKFETVNDYSAAIADYLCDEYGDMSKNLQMTESQRDVVGGIIHYCFEIEDSVNNAAHYLLEFLRSTDVNLENN